MAHNLTHVPSIPLLHFCFWASIIPLFWATLPAKSQCRLWSGEKSSPTCLHWAKNFAHLLHPGEKSSPRFYAAFCTDFSRNHQFDWDSRPAYSVTVTRLATCSINHWDRLLRDDRAKWLIRHGQFLFGAILFLLNYKCLFNVIQFLKECIAIREISAVYE